MSMGGEGGEGWRIYGGPHFFPNLKRGHVFSRFSKACDISIKRADKDTR